MTDRWGRGVGALVVLGVLWIVVYWWWEPSRPRVSFDGEGPAPGSVQPVSGAPGGGGGGTAGQPPVRRGPGGIEVIPPRFRSYTVRGGDTWESIAAAELGSARHATALREANPLMSELRTGRPIRIPLDPGNTQGVPVAGGPPPVPDGPGFVEYTVKQGDTLGGIARAYYGSTTYSDLIFEANRDRLPSKDDLRLGQKLRLPPKPS